MQYILMLLMAGGIVAADQLTKLWVLRDIPFHGHVDAIPGIFSLTYIQNRGAAWGSFEGMMWLFALIFLLFTGLLVWEFFKKQMPFKAFDRFCIVAIWAGGLGNMIDRLFRGYVVDMINLDFMSFPIFNVADCFITCGCIALMADLLFFNKDFWKEEKKTPEQVPEAETEGTDEET